MKPHYPKEDLSESKTDGDKHNDQSKTIIIDKLIDKAIDEINEKLTINTPATASATNEE